MIGGGTTGGSISIAAGASTITSAAGGLVSFSAGEGASGNGGSVNVAGGASSASLFSGGDVEVNSGDGAYTGGGIFLEAGSGALANSGTIMLKTQNSDDRAKLEDQLKENIDSIDITLSKEILKEIEDIHLSDPNPCV